MPERKLLDLISTAVTQLTERGVESARLNAERILCMVLQCQRVDLYLDRERLVTSDIVDRFEGMVSRRLAGEPLQYILGETEFYGLRIKCDRRSLIPRPETEVVVSTAITLLEQFELLYILDLACGSGCIGIALAMNLPQSSITAIDISEDALSLAKENVSMHSLMPRFAFHVGDMFGSVFGRDMLFDAIVSNPPYVTKSEWETLPVHIRAHEPRGALVSGEDGLDFIRTMLREVPGHLVPGGYLIFEIGFGQADDVRQLIERSQSLKLIEIARDYSDIERVVVARRGKKLG